MQSMSVVLPAPFGPMRQRSSPWSSVSVTSSSALKPSKLTLRFSTQSARGGRRAVGNGNGGDRRGPVVGDVVGWGDRHEAHIRRRVRTRAISRSWPTPARSLGVRPTRPWGKNSVTPTNSAPKAYSQADGNAAGEPALTAVDQPGAEQRAAQRSAPAHRHPDRHLDRVRRLHLARVDDSDLRDVERAGQTAQHRGQGPDEQLVVGRFVTAEAGLELGIAHRGQHAAEAARHHEAAEKVGARRARSRRRGRACAGSVGSCSGQPRMRLKSVSPLLPPKPVAFWKNSSIAA